MELLDRYLQAVSKHLPHARQQDILAELRANLEAQLEDKEAALGRPLTQGESEDWLRQIGAPMQVAARYLPQQSLIGPTIFPMYWFVLRTALLWAVVIYTVVNTVLIALSQPDAPTIAVALLRVPGVVFTVAAWVTFIFAAIEFLSARYPEKCAPFVQQTTQWSPTTLPPLEKLHPSLSPRSFPRAIAEVIFGFLFLIWLLLIPQYPVLLFGPGAKYFQQSPFQIAPVLLLFYVWVIALNVLQLVWRGVDLARGAWQRPQPLQHIVFKAFSLIPIAVLLRAPGHALVLLKSPELDSTRYGATLDALNEGIHKGLLVILAIVVLQLLWDLSRWLLNARRARSAAV